MMSFEIIEPNQLWYMIEPCVVEKKFHDFPSRHDAYSAAVAHRNSFENLPECKSYNFFLLSEIVDIADRYYFTATPTRNYWGYLEAFEKDLSWTVPAQEVNYPATISRWRTMLENPVRKYNMDIIRRNDLSRPEFEGFDVTVMEFIVGGRSDNEFYYPR